MRAVIDGKTVKLRDGDLLGVGGEARVYAWSGKAVKIYHPVPTGLTREQRRLALAIEKERAGKIGDYPRDLPSAMVCPVGPVLDESGKRTIGYVMDLVDGAEEIRRLSQRKWRKNAFSNGKVTELFAQIHEVLTAAHAKSVIVGDLNDGNILFAGATPWFIDTDSMQFDGYPCRVGHERFLDPDLYGVDLTRASQFTKDSDWYSYAVLLFVSLLYVHPYGGVHPTIATLLRRAEAAHSILRTDVRYPKGADHFSILPDELLDWFGQVFDQGRRDVFPRRLLDIRWTVCQCGTEHARSTCPSCSTLVPPTRRDPTVSHGRCQARTILETRGKVLAASMDGGLKYLYEEDGVLRREDRTAVLDCGLTLGLRFGLSGKATWLGHGGRLMRIEDGKVLERCSCATYQGETAFDSSPRGCFRLEKEWLVDATSGRRLGQVLEGQTWFRCGEHLGFGFYRAGLMTVYFLFRPGKAGIKVIDLPSLSGRLVEAHAAFDRGRILFQTATEENGKRTHDLYVLTGAGELRASVNGAPESRPFLAQLDGKAIVGDCILCPTDEGLLSLQVDGQSKTVVEGSLYRDTEPFVEAGATLIPGAGGTVYVVTAKEIRQLTLA